MSKISWFYIIFSFFLFSGCEKLDVPKDTPACIKSKIRNAEKHNIESIYEYTYNGKTVYLINANCCDWQNELYDDNCNLLCAPTGGIGGGGDGQCPDFAQNKTNEKLIWQNEE